MGVIHALQVIDEHQRCLHRRGSSGVLLSSSIIENLTKENEMFEMTFNGLVRLLDRTPSNRFEREMLTFAKTEYGKDWQFAYQHMLDHAGRAPRMGVHE
jgi:hypothetical protein